MNNEEKLFQIKTILGNFVFINEVNKSKEIQGKNVLSFTKFILGDFCLGVFVLSPFLASLGSKNFHLIMKWENHEPCIHLLLARNGGIMRYAFLYSY